MLTAGKDPSEVEQVEQAEASTAVPGVPGIPVASLWRTLGNYIFWNYKRGSIHYDIMVTLILLFIFVTPIFLNFKDKPVEHTSHPTAVLVVPDGQNGYLYQVPAAAISGTDDASIREQLLRIIEPIAGEASISRYEKGRDASGKPMYKVWVKK